MPLIFNFFLKLKPPIRPAPVILMLKKKPPRVTNRQTEMVMTYKMEKNWQFGKAKYQPVKYNVMHKKEEFSEVYGKHWLLNLNTIRK